jgi:cytochrome c-type biogenesis protein CcmH/NrfF
MRSASSVSPYLIIWVIPGSMLLLPFMAWFIDSRRKGRGPSETH